MKQSLRLLNSTRTMSKATRLQLGNVKTAYGDVQTAAGNHEKWGFLYRGVKYPLLAYIVGVPFIGVTQYVAAAYCQYRDMVVLSEHICYEDIKDRCLTPIPGWARLRTVQIIGENGPSLFRDPTPLDWLPFELKLGHVKRASV